MKTKEKQLNYLGIEILKRLKLQNLSQNDLSDIINVSGTTLSKIINKKQALTYKVARLIAVTLGETPQYWKMLYQKGVLEKLEKDKEFKLKLETAKELSLIYQYLPINSMIKEGILKTNKTDRNLLIDEVRKYLDVDNISKESLVNSYNEKNNDSISISNKFREYSKVIKLILEFLDNIDHFIDKKSLRISYSILLSDKVPPFARYSVFTNETNFNLTNCFEIEILFTNKIYLGYFDTLTIKQNYDTFVITFIRDLKDDEDDSKKIISNDKIGATSSKRIKVYKIKDILKSIIARYYIE